MSKVATFKAEAAKLSSNGNVVDAIVSYMLALSHHPTDYAHATEMAECDLESVEEVDEFIAAIKGMAA